MTTTSFRRVLPSATTSLISSLLPNMWKAQLKVLSVGCQQRAKVDKRDVSEGFFFQSQLAFTTTNYQLQFKLETEGVLDILMQFHLLTGCFSVFVVNRRPKLIVCQHFLLL